MPVLTAPDSHLNWIAGLMRTRRECGEIGAGEWSPIKTGNDATPGLRHDMNDSSTVILNNLSNTCHTIELDLDEGKITTLTDLLGDRRYEALDAENPRVRMNGYGYRWMRIGGIY
ncbi:MAG: hypothetical protein ACR2GI_00905 [Thermomicrobiales bacterium]